ncbi:MAG: hypothetical protein ACLSE4_10200 [Clostridium sp.]
MAHKADSQEICFIPTMITRALLSVRQKTCRGRGIL